MLYLKSSSSVPTPAFKNPVYIKKPALKPSHVIVLLALSRPLNAQAYRLFQPSEAILTDRLEQLRLARRVDRGLRLGRIA